MTIRNLEYLFEPRSVALIGASSNPGKPGHIIARNLLGGDFGGPVWFVNPKHERILERPVHAGVGDLPAAPDLAVIATPAETVPGLIDELGRAGTRAAIVVAGDMGGPGQAGAKLRQAMLDASRPWLLRLLGPNCLGMAVPGAGLNASVGHLQPTAGELAFVTQSGTVISSVVDWAQAWGIGFSHLVSLGDAADVDFGDMLDYLADRKAARAILLYVEAVTHVRKFMSAARAAARMKPVIVVKAGRYEASESAAATHTGSLASPDAVYDAAFRRAGLLRVGELGELFGATEILSRVQRIRGERLCVVTNSGGAGVMAVDELAEQGGHLAELSAESLAALGEVLPARRSGENPLDLGGNAGGERYARALEVVLADAGVDATLLLHCPTAVASGEDVARRAAEVWQAHARPVLLTSFVGETSMGPPREVCAEAGVPTFATPEQAVQGFMYLVNYRRNQQALMETPPSVPRRFVQDWETARRIIDHALADGREWLGDTEARALVGAYGLPVVEGTVAPTPEEAAAEAERLGVPVALKIVSPQILHKSDVDGVALDLDGHREVLEAARRMRRRVTERVPGAVIEGFLVERMLSRDGARELLVGAVEDQQFGPVVLFGQGGTATETIADTAVGLPPMNMRLAREVMERTRVWRLLSGYRNESAADIEAIGTVILQVAQLVADFAEIAELDVNPLFAYPDGVVAIDVRVRVRRAQGPAADRLAILPYPKWLEEEIELEDGRVFLLRPIVPEDEPSLLETFDELTQEEIRLRFHSPLKVLTHMMAARFTQLDYDREMALVLTEHGIPGKTRIYGVVRLHSDPDHEHGDFAIIVHHDLTGQGLGTWMMERIIEYARRCGLKEIGGDVLAENRVMFGLARKLGFRVRTKPGEPGVKRVVLEL